jgi:hypothetical protein
MMEVKIMEGVTLRPTPTVLTVSAYRVIYALNHDRSPWELTDAGWAIMDALKRGLQRRAK